MGAEVSTIALGIPTTPWVPERLASMQRLRVALHPGGVACDRYAEFTERESNAEWSVKLWNWLYSTGADWCLQLQDDVIAAPCFWRALRSMLGALPESAAIVGLSAVHPMAPEMARRGHRWYRTTGMLVGWAYAIRREALGQFLEVREELTRQVGDKCEDVILGTFAARSGYGVWHPCPTIVDHDTSIPSSYANDHHSTRRPQVTWRDFGEGSLTDPEWWKPSGAVEILPMPPQRNCWFCLERGAVSNSAKTGAGICGVCLGACMGSVLQGGRP